MLGDDPPYLSVGTEVSAKYKGAFCEAKIRKVVRSVKCRVTYKQGLGTSTLTDDQIKGTLRVGASVEAKHNDRKEYLEATITKIQDCSQYTVVFDDGDITTLRRTALCLKSGRHFAESETLDQLPLTHPEHFGNPVIGGRRGRRSRQTQDDSSEDDEDAPRGSNDSGSTSGGKEGTETEPEIGRVVCVELGDKKKKDNWFPGLVVAPTAQDTVRIRVRDEYLVRSFKDARYYTVPKKEATEFTKDLVNKIENNALKVAVERALLFLEKNELPPHWDRDSLFGNVVSSGNSDSDGELDSDSSDDEPREEKDHFVAQLYKFMDDRGTPINNCPMIGNEDIDLYRLFRAVYKLGGYNRVTNQNQWKLISRRLGFSMQNNASTHNLVKQAYKKFLHSFEDFYRKLGCTMVNHPRGGMRKQRPGRSLIRDKDRNTPVPTQDKPLIKTEKEDDDKDKRQNNIVPEDEVKKEKREIKKEVAVKQEEEVAPTKIKRKEETVDECASGQESDINNDVEEESSCSEKSQKSSSRLTPSSSVGGKMKGATAKPKEEQTKKKQPAPDKRKQDTKRPDKKEDKSNSKEEESAKTRSKSKDDVTKHQQQQPQQVQPQQQQQQQAQPQQQQPQQQPQQPQQQAGKLGTSLAGEQGRETKTPSRESDKKTLPSKQRRMTEEELKKRGRKRKEVETGAAAATVATAGTATNEKASKTGPTEEKQPLEYAPTYKGLVELGDRLKVYYGPTHESKVTYEAKVIDMEKDGTEAVYLVHYTGWNTRYDEWIKCTRIAQNFTQAQGRLKRAKAQARPPTPGAKVSSSSSASAAASGNATGNSASNAKTSTPSTLLGRRRAMSVAPASKESEERACTPVSRTKSPASSRTSARQLARNQEATRWRRAPSHAEPVAAAAVASSSAASGANESEVSEDSESALESDTSVPEAQPRKSRSRSRPQPQPQQQQQQQERGRREARRRAESRMKMEEASDHEEPDKDSEDYGAPQQCRRARRPRKPPVDVKVARPLDEMIKSEPDTDNDDQPKGRDFDLNQIRSELKGFDKAVKLEMTSSLQTASAIELHQQPAATMKLEKSDLMPDNRENVDRKIVPGQQLDVSPIKREQPFKIEVSRSDSTEDIYEFKEPEPFEFEARGKRDSSGSDKDKDKDRDKDKVKKRTFDEDQKCLKKRQKAPNSATTLTTTVTTTATAMSSTSPVKLEFKPDQSSQATEIIESKKKSRKIFKKSEDAGEDELETAEDVSKYSPKNYSGVVMYKRKNAMIRVVDDIFADEENSAEEKLNNDEVEGRTPKKRLPKGSISSIPVGSKNVEPSGFENIEIKKKSRKVFGKKVDEAEDDDEEISSKELDKLLLSYSASKTTAQLRKSDSSMDVSRSTSDTRDIKLKKEDDSGKNIKRKQKPLVPSVSESAEAIKKKPPLTPSKWTAIKKTGADTDESESDEGDATSLNFAREVTPAKYLSHYSGPKTKAVLTSETESLQERSADGKSDESKKSSLGHEKDEICKSKVQKELDKKRSEQGSSAAKSELKQELKSLDFTPIVPHSVPVPAPISTRLPATASIEEKLSLAAASVFARAKLKDNKRDEEREQNETATLRKVIKDALKKPESTLSLKKNKDKEDGKAKHELGEKRKQPVLDQLIPKKDPLQEIELHQDPLLEVINKDDDSPKTTTMPSVMKTYGNQKKIDHAVKMEESTWKRTKASGAVAVTMAVSSPLSDKRIEEQSSVNEASKECASLRKDTAPSKIKPSIDRDSVDSTDSSDSERRLTIIDSEDAADDKCNESSSEAKTTKPLVESATTGYLSGSRGSLEKQIIVGLTVASVIQAKVAKVEEDGENLNSLLCEEEIPGSPTPGTESVDHEHKVSVVTQQNFLKCEIGSKVSAGFAGTQVSLNQQTTSFAVAVSAGGSVTVPQTTSSLVTMSVQASSATPLRQSQAHLLMQQQAVPAVQLQPQQQPVAAALQQVVVGLVAQHRRQSDEAAPVMDNTPPTTPDSTISNLSGSPRDERTGGSTPSSSEDNNSKANRDSSEIENETVAGKPTSEAVAMGSEDDASPLLSPEFVPEAQSNSAKGVPSKRAGTAAPDIDNTSPKKRKKRKDQDIANTATLSPAPASNASGKKSPRQATRSSRQATASDSDDTSENSTQYNNNLAPSSINTSVGISITPNVIAAISSIASFSTNSTRPIRFNFLTDLDPSLDGNQRVQILMQRITELRKVYNNCKGELAAIERRRKKIKRRKREAQKAAKAEMQQACS